MTSGGKGYRLCATILQNFSIHTCLFHATTSVFLLDMYLSLCFVDIFGQFIGHFLAPDYHTCFPSFLCMLILLNRRRRPRFLCAVWNLSNYPQLNLEDPKLTKVLGSDRCLHPQAPVFSTVPENCAFLLKPYPFSETSSCSPPTRGAGGCFLHQPATFLGGSGSSLQQALLPWGGDSSLCTGNEGVLYTAASV